MFSHLGKKIEENFPLAMRYLTWMELENDLETYYIVMVSLREGRMLNTTMALGANLIKKGLHREIIYYNGEEDKPKPD
ncbi:hypothetical protein ERO13_A03G176575v2 [Gossypium hirsutum]|nr:hypothetical protein ERO13_A03G176575v2 [Gossypium hirsutum]